MEVKLTPPSLLTICRTNLPLLRLHLSFWPAKGRQEQWMAPPISTLISRGRCMLVAKAAHTTFTILETEP